MKLAYNIFMNEGTVNPTLAPIILMHCAFENKDAWMMVGPQLAKHTGRKVYAIDFRNHGDSPWSDEINVNLLRNDLKDFMDQHQIPKAVLVGHSLGGLVAMVFSFWQPHKVEKIVVEDTTIVKPEHKLTHLVPTLIQLLDDFMTEAKCHDQKSMEEEVDFFFRALLPMVKIPEEVADLLWYKAPFKWNGERMVMKNNFEVLSKALLDGVFFQQIEGVYDGEALFLCGKDSQFKVHEDPLIPKYFPRASFIIYENTGHFIHYLYGDKFTKDVSDFINDSTGLAMQSKM